MSGTAEATQQSAKICAPLPMSARVPFELRRIERDRVIHNLFKRDIAAAAGITARHYRRLLSGQSPLSDGMLARLEKAISDLTSEASAQDVPKLSTARSLRQLFEVAFLATCQFHGLTPSIARELLKNDGKTRAANPAWARASYARRDAAYIAAIVIEVMQKDLAALIGVTPSAVCQAMRKAQDQRENPTFDALCDDAVLALREMLS